MFAIEARFESLDHQIELACNARDEEVAANLRSYGTVLICGFVERSVEVIVLERLKSRAQSRVLNFVKSHFKRGTNYNCEAICQLLERFEPDWKNNFKDFMNDNEKEVDGLTSTYAVRNSVAHGGSTGINAKTLRERRDGAKKIVGALILATVG